MGPGARVAVLLIFGATAVAAAAGYIPPISPRGPLARLAWVQESRDGFQVSRPRWVDDSAIPALALAEALDSSLTRLRLPRPSSLPRIIETRSLEEAARWNGGLAVPGTFTDRGDVVLVAQMISPVLLRHELAHAVLHDVWGSPHASVAWLDEGLATVAAGCAGYSGSAVAAVLLRRGRLPRLSDLVAEFRAVPNFEAYLAAASVAEWLEATDREAMLRKLWEEGSVALGLVEAVESEWTDYLASVPPVPWEPGRGCVAGPGPRS